MKFVSPKANKNIADLMNEIGKQCEGHIGVIVVLRDLDKKVDENDACLLVHDGSKAFAKEALRYVAE